MATADRPDIDLDDDLARGPAGPMSEAEFVAWCAEDVRAEWVDGEVVVMSPSSTRHVQVVTWLCWIMGAFVERHDLGELLAGDLMVRFAALRRRRVPDILFLDRSRLHLLGTNHFEGAPDLAVEVVSPDSERRDRVEKLREYERAGVREYWIIDPLNDEIEIHSLDDAGRYRAVVPTDGRIASTVLPGFWLRPEWLRQSPLPNKRATLRAMGLDD